MSKTGLVLFQVVSRHEYPVKPSSADINENILSEQCREEYQLTEENVKSAKSLDQVGLQVLTDMFARRTETTQLYLIQYLLLV